MTDSSSRACHRQFRAKLIIVVNKTNEPNQWSREKLINSAIAMASGPELTELTLDNISQMHGLTHDQITQFFATDEELVLAAMDYLRDMVREHVCLLDSSDFATSVRELVTSFANFSSSNPLICRATCSLLMTAPELDVQDPNPLLSRAAEIVHREVPDAEPWLRMTRTVAIFSALHGFAHLSAVSVIQHMSKPAKDHLVGTLANSLVTGIGDSLISGRALTVAPNGFLQSIDFQPVPPAKDFPKLTPDQQRCALFRGAVEIVAEEGVEAITVEAAAERAGLSLQDARTLLLPDRSLADQLEEHLESQAASIISQYVKLMPKDTPVLQKGKAIGLGYARYAFMDPIGFDVYTEIASGSLVPGSFHETEVKFKRGKTFNLLVSAARKAIVEGGGTQMSWALYESTVMLWILTHGISHALANGPMRTLPKQMKLDLVSPVLDIAIASFVRTLELELPGIEDSPVVPP